MIGMIALSGIVTRDAIILVDFIHVSLARGRSRSMPSGKPGGATAADSLDGYGGHARRRPNHFRPDLLRLAWTLIFGLFASTLFTLFVIPVACWLLYANTPGHGAVVSSMDHEER